MSDSSFDLIVLGAGPGGYVCALRAAQLGFKVALVDKRATLGGTCLNVGCIPSKALLHSTEILSAARDHGKKHGITGNIEVDLEALMKNKDSVVKKLVGGVGQLVKARKIQFFQGLGSFVSSDTVAIEGEEKTEIKGKNIVIATGSKTVELPFLPFDGEKIISSDEGIALKEIPENLVVVGGGAIGLELGTVWQRLGSKVDVVEFLPKIAPNYDEEVSKLAERILKKQGLTFHKSTKVTGSHEGKKGKIVLEAEGSKGKVEFEADKVLVSVGRAPVTEGLKLEAAGVKTDDRGRIEVDDHFSTGVDGVYAIGDVIKGPMLAHKAEEEGVALAENLAGKAGHVNYGVIPAVIYTDPEIASAGITAEQAKEQGLSIKTGKFPLTANGRAMATDATDGVVIVHADAKTDKVLGIQIVARNASELIAAAVTHMEYGGSAEDIARTVHAHPTLSEALKEAAMAVDGRAIHSM
ncbi:dihydrolipoyl dehydrogenase [Puniceicoccus vermicola]|uniref:Dihydrolipoyl dehydrogenase n=1 Tax=Puniceicoccus vermicola TaxID=388746 RepID=A0A7X1B1U2_9BACT|nr:dihydrolipoyl dehydrogenase [Puniceicoccus vermicola]MBC2604066.1 dihydrolipoyl dehydrogenase [Puniceicoccus vermicola]